MVCDAACEFFELQILIVLVNVLYWLLLVDTLVQENEVAWSSPLPDVGKGVLLIQTIRVGVGSRLLLLIDSQTLVLDTLFHGPDVLREHRLLLDLLILSERSRLEAGWRVLMIWVGEQVHRAEANCLLALD